MFAAVIPNLDSIREFRVQTSNFDAELGNFSGGQVVMTTKSGENDIHGSAFKFVRNTNLSARNFFAPERARYNRHQFGGTAGAPIRRDKIYFFADYQGTRMARGVDTGLISVPSAAARSGDFTADPGVLTGAVKGEYWAERLSGKLGYTVVPGEPYYSPGCTSSTQCVLPNARLPQRAWSAPAKALLSYIPTPNSAGIDSPPRHTKRRCETIRAVFEWMPTHAAARCRRITFPTSIYLTIRTQPRRQAPMCPGSMRSRWAEPNWQLLA